MLVDTIRGERETVNDLMFMWLIEITGWGIFNSVVMLDGRNLEFRNLGNFQVFRLRPKSPVALHR